MKKNQIVIQKGAWRAEPALERKEDMSAKIAKDTLLFRKNGGRIKKIPIGLTGLSYNSYTPKRRTLKNAGIGGKK